MEYTKIQTEAKGTADISTDSGITRSPTLEEAIATAGYCGVYDTEPPTQDIEVWCESCHCHDNFPSDNKSKRIGDWWEQDCQECGADDLIVVRTGTQAQEEGDF